MDALLSLNLIVLIITAVISFILGWVVIRSDHRSATNLIFTIQSWSAATWLFANHFALQPHLSEFSLIFSRLSIFLAVPQILAVYLLSHTLPRKDTQLSKTTLRIVLIVGIVLMLITISPFAFTDVKILEGSVQPIPGLGMGVFALFALYFCVDALYTFIKRYRKSEGIEKKQIRFVMSGILVMFGLIILGILIPVLVFQSTFLVPFSPLFVLVFLGLTAYAIIQHQLFDLRVIATEVVTFILWVVLFSKLFVAGSTSERLVDLSIFITIVIFGIFLIKSVRKEIEQRRELEVLNKRLEDLDKQKDEFLNIASHELRAPMTAIKGYISMTQDGDGGEIPVAAQEMLSEAANENDRMIRLVNNMLNVARIEEGRMVYEIGEVNLAEVVKRVFDEFKFDAKNKALEYIYVPTNGLHDRIVVDVDRIHEVASNLINNAIKYTDAGKVEVRLTNPDTSCIRFEIEDTGPGMTSDEVGKLFSKFYRAESYMGKAMGTGLGLYISKLLVEKFGGKIGVKSEKGKGSLFWFELPVKG